MLLYLLYFYILIVFMYGQWKLLERFMMWATIQKHLFDWEREENGRS